MDSALGLIGLALRAGKLAVGEEPCALACRARDCRLLLLASDAGAATLRRAQRMAEEGQCLTLTLPWDRETLGGALGRNVCAVAALTDLGLAQAVAGKLAAADAPRYGETAERLAVKAQRAQQRRQARGGQTRRERPAGKRKK